MNDYNFGNFVCQLREQQGLTQADIASQLGVTAAAVSKWENGSAKPRVEVLFQLAQILGVRPEELMAGRHLEDERLDPEAVRQINERYEHLRRIELHNTTKTKLFRLLAWVIDWNIIGAAVLLVTTILAPVLVSSDGASNASSAGLLFLLILCYPVCFVLRDWIFCGRSLGKRILGLTVLNSQTGDAPKKSQLLLRNVFLFFLQIDAVILLITGLSLGDRVAHTVVVPKKDLNLTFAPHTLEENTQRINQYPSTHANEKKKTVMWVCIVAAVAVLLIGSMVAIVSVSLGLQKDTAEYEMAYNYLIESEVFEESGIDPKNVKLASYQFQSTTSANGNTHNDIRFGFRIGFLRQVYVICHDTGEGVFVCQECTGF